MAGEERPYHAGLTEETEDWSGGRKDWDGDPELSMYKSRGPVSEGPEGQ